MKEVFSKSFWQGVKKTFDESREGPAPADNGASSTPDSPAIRSSGPPGAKPPEMASEEASLDEE
jgi:hypothetical protein